MQEKDLFNQPAGGQGAYDLEAAAAMDAVKDAEAAKAMQMKQF